MSQTFSIGAYASYTQDRLDTVFQASVQLSDGSLALVYFDGSLNWQVAWSSDRVNFTNVAGLNDSGQTYATTVYKRVALARDASDNLYIAFWYGGNPDTIYVYKGTKTGTGAWTITYGGSVNSGSAYGGNSIALAWCNTGGGTGGAGHLILTANSNNVALCAIIDAGALASGTLTLTDSISNGGMLGGAGGYFLDLAPDGFGATSGLSANTGWVGKWSVSSAGLLTQSLIYTFTTNPYSGWADGALVRYGSGAWAYVTPSTTTIHGYMVSLFTASGAVAVALDAGTPTNMPLVGDTPGLWAASVVGSRLVIFALNSSSTSLYRLSAILGSSTVTWDTAATLDTTLTVAGTSVSTVKAPVGAVVDWQTGTQTSPYPLLGGSTSIVNAPLAPTLAAPANASYIDVSSGETFSWTYNPGTGSGTQSAYALRAKLSGAGSYVYWNAGTSSWQSTIVWNTSTAGSVTLAGSAQFVNGNTYNWSVATQESNQSLQGPFATDNTFIAQAAPTATVSAPTGTATTQTPLVTWTETLAGGASQTAFRVVIYNSITYGEVGFTPGTTAGSADSGVVSSATTSWQCPTILANGTSFRAYVQLTETGGQTGQWSYSSFTVVADQPATPTLTLTPTSDVNGAPIVNVSVQCHDNLLSADDASIEGTIGTWVANANCSVARVATFPVDGSYSLSLTSTAAGNMSARTANGTSGYAVNAGSVYTALASFRAGASARSVRVDVMWYNAAGTYLSSSTGATVTDATGSATQAALSGVTAPAGAAYATVVVNVLATGAAAEVHYVDTIGLFPGTVTSWTRGGLNGVTTVLVEESDDSGATWRTMRNASALTPSWPGQLVTASDYEVIPSSVREYRASVSATLSGTTVVSGYATGTTTPPLPTGWWLETIVVQGSSAPATELMLNVIAHDTSRHEQSTAHYALGRTDPVTLADVVTLGSGTLTVMLFSAADYTTLTALAAAQAILYLASPYLGESRYVRIGPPGPTGGGGTANAVKHTALAPSSGANPVRSVTVPWVETERP